MSLLDKILMKSKLDWPPFSKKEFRSVIKKYSNSSILEPNHILWKHLKFIIKDNRCIINFVNIVNACINLSVTNFIQFVSPQPVDRFSQTKLCWKALNKGYPHICRIYKSNNKWLRYQDISSYKSFVC